MNKLTTAKRAQVIRCLVDGNGIRATVRITGVAKDTVTKLLVDLGRVCSDFQDRVMHDLPCKRIQLDEIWAFCYAKEKNVPEEKKGQPGYGDLWTWVAIDADTKLVPAWLVGGRDSEYAHAFVMDLRKRLANRVQLTSDGHKPYLEAVEQAFGADVDYAMLVKLYGGSGEGEAGTAQRKYSPGECVGARKSTVAGSPDPEHVSTSFAERQNLTMRMAMRRFTRLTNGFSKKLSNHEASVALHFMNYNFCRIHQTLRVTPAMAAKVTDRLWEVEDVVALLDAAAPKPSKRGPYKPRAAAISG
jgi:IS1 family transposase